MDKQDRLPIPEVYNLDYVTMTTRFWEVAVNNSLSAAELRVYCWYAGNCSVYTGQTNKEIDFKDMATTLKISYDSVRKATKRLQKIQYDGKGTLIERLGGRALQFLLPDVLHLSDILRDQSLRRREKKAEERIDRELKNLRRKGFVSIEMENAKAKEICAELGLESESYTRLMNNYSP